jgi:hypothetical protein
VTPELLKLAQPPTHGRELVGLPSDLYARLGLPARNFALQMRE